MVNIFSIFIFITIGFVDHLTTNDLRSNAHAWLGPHCRTFNVFWRDWNMLSVVNCPLTKFNDSLAFRLSDETVGQSPSAGPWASGPPSIIPLSSSSSSSNNEATEPPDLQDSPLGQWFNGGAAACSPVAIVKPFPSKSHQHESPSAPGIWRQGRPLQWQRKKPWPKKSWAGTARPTFQNPSQVSQCIFGYHCHRPEWPTEEDLSHVSLPRGTMQAETKHSLWSKRQCEKAGKQSRRSRTGFGMALGHEAKAQSPRIGLRAGPAAVCPSAPRVDGRKCDSLELLSDARSGLGGTRPANHSRQGRRRLPPHRFGRWIRKYVHKCVPLRDKMCITSSDNLTLWRPPLPPKVWSGGGVSSVSDNKLKTAQFRPCEQVRWWCEAVKVRHDGMLSAEWWWQRASALQHSGCGRRGI